MILDRPIFNESICRWMDGWILEMEWMDGWMDGWMDECILSLKHHVRWRESSLFPVGLIFFFTVATLMHRVASIQQCHANPVNYRTKTKRHTDYSTAPIHCTLDLSRGAKV